MAWTDNLVAWTKQVADKYDLQLGRRLGQNFLVNKNILEKVIESAELQPTDRVLEVGAGIGTLTMALMEKEVTLVSVEYDRKLIPILNKIVDTQNKFKLLAGDILKIKDEQLVEALGTKTDFKIVANLPYEISGAFLKRFLTSELKPLLMVLMLQKEVGERLIAKPGQMNLLALQAQLYSKVQIIQTVSKQCFYPAPQVESVIVRFYPKSITELRQIISVEQESIFWQLAKAGFAHKRKFLLSNIVNGLSIDKTVMRGVFVQASLSFEARAQELSIEKWLELAKIYQSQL